MNWENRDLANWQKRFINLVVDSASIIGIFLILLYISPYVLSIFHFDFEIDLNAILFFVYVIYYIFLELFTGRTIGKFLSGTEVVTFNGSKPGLKKIFIRTLVRLITIEIISFFNKKPLGWHDSLSGTQVVLKK